MDMDNNDIGRKAFSLFLGETEIINSKDADRYFVIGNGNVQLVPAKDIDIDNNGRAFQGDIWGQRYNASVTVTVTLTSQTAVHWCPNQSFAFLEVLPAVLT